MLFLFHFYSVEIALEFLLDHLLSHLRKHDCLDLSLVLTSDALSFNTKTIHYYIEVWIAEAAGANKAKTSF